MSADTMGFTFSRVDAAGALDRLRQIGPFRVLYERPLAALETAVAWAPEPDIVEFELPWDEAQRFMEWLAREIEPGRGDPYTPA